MADGKKQTLRKQIEHTIVDPVLPIEEKVARALAERGEFLGTLSADDLAVILRKVLYTLVDEQKVAGVDVPITHNVSRMEVNITGREATVFCEVHIHSPIKAFITFDYVLENDHHSDHGRLRLKGNRLTVKEVTRPFDIGARAALAVMGVRGIALQELSDPNAVIKRTLPAQLVQHGFDGDIDDVALELLDDNTLTVYISANGA